MSYGRRWKAKTLHACRLHGAKRLVFSALLVLCDWKGRVRKPYHEIASAAGISPRNAFRCLRELIDTDYLLVLEKGSGRRPTMLQVVPADQIEERSCAVMEDTATKTVAVPNVYVANRVNYAQLVEQCAKPRARSVPAKRSNGNGAIQH